MYSLCYVLYLFICHEEAVGGGEFGRCYLQLFDGVGTDNVHLCSFVKHDSEWVFIMGDCGHFEGASMHCSC